MKTLPPEDYNSALTVLEEVPINTCFALSVLKKHVRGNVFVDIIENPEAYYIVHPSGMSLLFGNLDNQEFKEHLTKYLLGQSNLRQGDESLQVVPELEQLIDDILSESMCLYSQINNQNAKNYKVAKDKRINFKFNEEYFINLTKDLHLDHLEIKTVDVALFDRINGAAVPNQFWDSATNFMKFGKGFSIMQENIPIATAFSSFIHDNMLEIGVETNPQYRKKGLGFFVCSKLISYCLDNDLEPVWSCRYGNQGSVALANKLGFEQTIEIPYYELLQ